MLYIGVPDKLLAKWLENKDYMVASDEGEAIGIAGGYYLATGKRAIVFMSADGFCNATNPLTSWIIPENIEMDLVISYGRRESQHRIMSDILEPLLKLLKYDPKRIFIKLLKKT